MSYLRPSGWTLVLALTLIPTGAHAQTQERCTRGDCSYRFDDDSLGAPGFNARPALGSRRIRPRSVCCSFVRGRHSCPSF